MKYPFQMNASELSEEVAHRNVRMVEVRAWRDAAVADGWTIVPTYGDHEPVERASSLTRDGFKVLILTRPAKDSTDIPVVAINAWGPDRRTLDHVLTPHYDMTVLRAGVRTCQNCGAKDVDTVGVHFAMRSCKACAPALKAKYEVGNWTE